ncbi:MAG: imidazoleglycerol-phosphate dehydratase HisB [Deltaproteobacteria bacterium]|nr:MAG: imidazoleglycerol-phosphate dehydratase HisB [Deltaproteobacteria bacterium]
MDRIAEIKRKTKETEIYLRIDLNGKGNFSIDSGIPFMDHMLCLMSLHGFLDMDLKAKGDIDVDYHHTVEDIGICIGMGIKKAFGDKTGIKRYGEATIPMDDALVRVVVDVSGRPFLSYNVPLKNPFTGNFDVRLIKEFFYALAINAGITLHIDLLAGEEPHHVAEAVFKAFAKALDRAKEEELRLSGQVLSTKGIL